MRSILFLSLFMLSKIAFSQVENCEEDSGKKLMKAVKTNTTQTCPDAEKLSLLCLDINEHRREPEGSKYVYAYRRKIFEAACVDLKDKEDVRRKKIQDMWKKLESKLICNNSQFDVINGSIIKYAASSMYDQFLDDVIYWGVDLNKVDETDGRTVLDYLRDTIKRYRGMSTGKILQDYYDMLREAGAKHKSEL